MPRLGPGGLVGDVAHILCFGGLLRVRGQKAAYSRIGGRAV